MQPVYRHTQSGLLLSLSTLPGALALLAAALLCRGPLTLPLVLVALVLGAVGYVFSSLTVEVTPTELTWFFGPGALRKRVARAEIASARPVVNKWWWGWGIHLTPRGWLYNVGGLEAVEITFRDGRTLRIGSDETASLAQALAARH
jgi:hypothetical protein